MALVHSSTSGTFPSAWGKTAKRPKNENSNKALMSRTRTLTLAYDEMETVKILPDNYRVSIRFCISIPHYILSFY
jgi:hypothetical protein